MIKKIVSLLAGGGLVLATALPAFAAHTCSNINTGSTSNNYCNRVIEKVKNLRVSNFGTVNHSAFFFANSGNNTSDNNTNMTGNAGVETNDADITEIGSAAGLNTINADVDQADTTVDEQGKNENTGANSNNTVTLNTTKNLTINVTNNGTIDHSVEVIANTGYNSSSNNTIGGSVKTGKASIVGNIVTVLNDVVLKLKQ